MSHHHQHPEDPIEHPDGFGPDGPPPPIPPTNVVEEDGEPGPDGPPPPIPPTE